MPTIDAPTYRSIFGLWPTGVSVVTGLDAEGRPLGLVIGSLCSVSIDPPLLAFCPQNSSTTWQAIRPSGHFCVNILAHDQAAHCWRFASGDPSRRFDGVEHALTAGGVPRLAGCCAWIEADVAQEIPAGDHSIVIGAITALEMGQGHLPLAFARGRLGRVEAVADQSGDHFDDWERAWRSLFTEQGSPTRYGTNKPSTERT